MLQSSFVKPVLADGQDTAQGTSTTLPQSILEVVDFNAKYNAYYTFCVQARKDDTTGGIALTEVTHRDLKDLVLACSQRLQTVLPAVQRDVRIAKHRADEVAEEKEGGEMTDIAPVAVLMESSIDLFIHMLSLMRLGVPVLLLSARLSPAAIRHLLAKVGATAIIASPRLISNATSSLNSSGQDSVSLESVAPTVVLIESQPIASLGTGVKGDDLKYVTDAPLRLGPYSPRHRHLILHSSGTTGLPKPVYCSPQYLVGFAACHSFAGQAPGLCLSTLPLYHGFGLIAPCLSLGAGMPACLPPSTSIPNAISVLDLLAMTNARCLMSVPSILEDIVALPDKTSERLGALAFVAFGGGRLKPWAGEQLRAQGVALLNHYGATETGPVSPIFIPDANYDYRYFRLRADIDMKLESAEQSSSGEQYYKLSVKPPGVDSVPFEIQDRLVANSNAPTTDFNAVGRSDDVIVLANGEKVLPGILEAALCRSPLVKTAVAFGEGQSEIGVLIQPFEDVQSDCEEYIGQVWKLVEETNAQMDAHARVTTEQSVIVISSDEVVPRSDKGSVLRRETYACFKHDIEQLYTRLASAKGVVCVTTLRQDHLTEDIKTLIASKLKLKVEAGDWTVHHDLFELGMDSLQALQLRRLLMTALPARDDTTLKATEVITQSFVYEHPSVEQMANAISRALSGIQNEVHEFEEDALRDLVQQFGLGGQPQDKVVLLTGATGSLGTHVLACLLRDPSISRVICFNRHKLGADGRQRQLSALESRHIKVEFIHLAKLQVLTSPDMVLERLGLPQTEYVSLQETVTHIMHAAWPMDFNRTLSSFSGAFQTLHNLIELTQQIRRHQIYAAGVPRLLFISSIATAGYYARETGETVVPETPMPSPSCALDMGYAQAKLVCERMVEEARTHLSKSVDIGYVRVGQMVANSATGWWNMHEHIPTLIKSSESVGRLPRLAGTFSWISVDDAAEVVCDILLQDTTPMALVYHLENPLRHSWLDLLTYLASSSTGGNANSLASNGVHALLHLSDSTLLPFEQWLAQLRASCKSLEDISATTLLLSFFENDFIHMACGDVVLDTCQARRASTALRQVDVIPFGLVARALRMWQKSGFLR